MDQKFTRLAIILVLAAIGYSVLSTPGGEFSVDVYKLKSILMYLLLGLAAYAVYLTLRQPPRPPGV